MHSFSELIKYITLYIFQDPAGWDDVLTPGRIEGECHAPNCDGNTAVRMSFDLSNDYFTQVYSLIKNCLDLGTRYQFGFFFFFLFKFAGR